MAKAKQSSTVEVFIEGKKKKVQVTGSTLNHILKELNFTPETMIVTVDGKVALPSSKIPNGKIELFQVISGG